tara:strand:+ start:1170 stop:1568 length:399 start_codon:yes stop_codon:yes gene_type:complete
MNEKKPSTYRELSDPSSPPKSSVEAAKRIVASLECRKGDILSDPKFLESIVRHALDHPDEFNRERVGEPSASTKKIQRHELSGRTNKLKLTCWLSDAEFDQMESYREHRGDRSHSDMWNQVICLVLGALRSL